jgi:hypothetical protein
MRSHADVPMGAMWLFDPGTGRPAPTYVADLKGASSVAHVYGKPFTGAESMTAFHRPWSYTPRRLKHIADLELALGVTRFCIHTSPHQPIQVPPPGIALSPHLGQVFVRTEPWAELAGPWVDYLARCSWLLNQGLPAVDVAVFIGEEAPVTALYGEHVDRTVPPGFDYDYVNLDALEQRFEVEGGDLVAGTVRYRVLYLGGSSARMTVRALRRLVDLVTAGATIVGRRPAGSPSLADDGPEHERLRDVLWGPGDRRGTVLETADLAAALRDLGIEPSLMVDGADLLRIGRRTAAGEIIFLANPVPEPVMVTLRKPSGPAPVAWDPVTLRREALPEVDGGYRLSLPAVGSVFIVDGGNAAAPWQEPDAEVPLVSEWHLTLPGVLDTVLPAGVRPWTELGSEAAGFAGVGTYSTDVDVDEQVLHGRAAVLVLSDVGDLAGVRINGIDCGVVWTSPFRIEVTRALRPGRNTVQVDVASAWMNRLIAQASAPASEIFAPVVGVYAPTAPLRPSGISGSVALQMFGAHAQ